MSKNIFIYIFSLLIFLSLSLEAVAKQISSKDIDMSKLVRVNAKNNVNCIEYFIIDGKDYCSTEPLLKLPNANKQEAKEAEKLVLFFDKDNWKAAAIYNDLPLPAIEYTRNNEKLTSWTELITTNYLAGQFPEAALKQTAEFVKKSLESQNLNMDFIYHSQSKTDIVFEFKVKGPTKYIQNEIQRILLSDQGMHIVHYVTKKANMGNKQRKEWINLLKQARPKN